MVGGSNMVNREEFNSVEGRVDALERAIVEIQTLIKAIKPVAVMVGLHLGINIAQFV